MSADVRQRLRAAAPVPGSSVDTGRLISEGLRRRRSRMIARMVATTLLVVIAIGGVLVIRSDEDRVPPAQQRLEPAPSPSVFGGWEVESGWDQIADPPEPRAKGVEVWTGSELILYGGQSYSGGLAPPGGSAYDPRTDTWRSLAEGPLDPRRGEGGVWTGTEMIIWGGYDFAPGDEEGAAYSPVLDRWRPLADSPLDVRAPVAAVWTGAEVIVWGNTDRSTADVDGAAYDPSTNEWRRIAPAPIALNQGQGIWTGTEMIVLGSLLDQNNHSEAMMAQGIAYDPADDTWRVLPESRLSPQASSAVWNGREMVAWDYQAIARAYEPITDSWRSLPEMPFGSSECYPASAATKDAMLALFCGVAASYDFESDAWMRVDPPTVELGHQPVAAGDVFLVAGSNHESTFNTAFVFRPYPRGTVLHLSPRFWPQIGWLSYSTGPVEEGSGDQPTGWTSTVDLGRDFRSIRERLGRLGDRDIAIVASVIAAEDEPNQPSENFPTRGLPLDISDAEIRPLWEGQPDPDIPQYLLLGEVRGRLLDVRIYFGSQDPNREMLDRAQKQLSGLILP